VPPSTSSCLRYILARERFHPLPLQLPAKVAAVLVMLRLFWIQPTAFRSPLPTPLISDPSRLSAMSLDVLSYANFSFTNGRTFVQWFSSLSPACTSCVLACTPRVGLQLVRQNGLLWIAGAVLCDVLCCCQHSCFRSFAGTKFHKLLGYFQTSFIPHIRRHLRP